VIPCHFGAGKTSLARDYKVVFYVLGEAASRKIVSEYLAVAKSSTAHPSLFATTFLLEDGLPA
jgi:hypothetical protein